MRQIQVWRERETSQVEAKRLKKAAFMKRETSVARACYHYGTEGHSSINRINSSLKSAGVERSFMVMAGFLALHH